jgi:hypothetical protein
MKGLTSISGQALRAFTMSSSWPIVFLLAVIAAAVWYDDNIASANANAANSASPPPLVERK